MGEEDLKAGDEEEEVVKLEDGENDVVVALVEQQQQQQQQHREHSEEEKVEGDEQQLKHDQVKDIEEYVSRLNDDKWPNVNGVYDAQGEWHDWNEMTYSYTYGDAELIILPYTVCSINLSGSQQLTATPST